MTPSLPLLDLTRRYCEPHRRYHGIEHPAHMLWLGRQHALTDEQVAAVWYHDAVFDPRRSDNEELSAALAREQLTAIGWTANSVQLVERMVLDTRPHAPSIEESRAVVDLDLEPLAETWELFQRNVIHLRVEFAHLDDATFEANRRGFLADMLARERIFSTSWGARLEAPARRNLERSLKELENRP
ncbi:MAG: metal-dependent phosphohydrolase [Planctomycetes bacterium]|nr:metal-dependent phosphohydrolase [Planctomycetota bacterium]